MKRYLGKKQRWTVLLIMILIVVSGFSVFAAKPDKKAPTAPADVRASTVTDTKVQLAWNASSDNVGVESYDIYKDNRLVGSSKTTTYETNGLTAETTYKFFIKAKDLSGNISKSSNIVTVTTKSLSAAGTTPAGALDTADTGTAAVTGENTVRTSDTDQTGGTDTDTQTDQAAGNGGPADSGQAGSGTGGSNTSTEANPSAGAGSTDPNQSGGTGQEPAAEPVKPVGPNPAVVAMDTGTNRVVGYYAAWSSYSGYTPDKIDTAKVEYINYAFANIGSDYRITLGYPDIDPANFARLNALKKSNPGLKTLISVGGWTWSGRFSDAALTESSRNTFADSCVEFMVKYGFDGVDIDWEYPVGGGMAGNGKRPEDKQNFTLLMQKIRERLNARGEADGRHYLLTFAGAATDSFVNNTELNKLSQYVDFANIMTYDIHGAWDSYTDFNAPLYQNNDVVPHYKWSIDLAVNSWLNAGFPGRQLVMGIPFYGYLYNAAVNSNNGLYQSYSGSASISYANIVGNYLSNPQFVRYYHEQSEVPWLFNGSTFISYDDEQSIGAKVQFIKNKGLGGAMIWELSQDADGVLLNSLYGNIK